MAENEQDAVLREWRESAPYWHEHNDIIRVMFAPLTQVLIEQAGIVAGNSVLDVAGGAGEPSFTIAQLVGPGGSVTYTDVVAEMVAGAANEARRRGLTNIKFHQCAADSLPFDSNSFHATVSRLGVMFFPDILKALKEMVRVTKREGAVSLAVWGKSEFNPFVHIVTDVMSRYVAMPPPAEDAFGAFRFAEPGKLAGILRDAGAGKVSEMQFTFHIQAPISPEGFWKVRSETSGTLREKLASLPSSQAQQVAKEVQEAVRKYFPNDEMNFPAQMIIVTGSFS